MAHAEMTEIWPRDGRIRVLGTLVGADDTSRWRLELTAVPVRGGGMKGLVKKVLRGSSRRSFPAPVVGGHFQVEVPVQTLAGLVPHREWELHLVAGSQRLRLGRYDDDVPVKTHIFRYPAQPVWRGRVRPVFTKTNDLSIRVTR